MSTLGKNLLREAFSGEDSFANVEDVARTTQSCDLKEVVERLVEQKLLSVELFRDPSGDSSREIMGIITQKRARTVLQSLQTLSEQEIETILSTCRVRGTVEDLFNYLDFIMLARTFKVDNLEHDNRQIENLRETIKTSKSKLHSPVRRSRETTRRKRWPCIAIPAKIEAGPLHAEREEGANLQENYQKQRRESRLPRVPEDAEARR